jgi:hypothetical protein
MKKNMNTTDRVIRFLIGIALLIWTCFSFSWILLVITLFAFFEALFSWCILYQILGKNNCSCKK